MLGSLASGALADAVGRRRTFQLNAVVMVVAAAVQSLSSSVVLFSLGRWLAGLASGAATAMPNSYINEIAPPHLRSHLGVGFQVSISIGILLVGASFFLVDGSPSAWRWIAAAPGLLGLVCLLGTPRWLVESPSWLLTQGRREDAERALERLVGPAHVHAALEWTSAGAGARDVQPQEKRSTWRALVSPPYRRQTTLALALAAALQLTGSSVAFLYSASLFVAAGVADDRVGTLVVNIASLLPSFVAGAWAQRVGNRAAIQRGQLAMLGSAVGLTAALALELPVAAIACVALYVVAFSLSLGAWALLIAAEVLPDHLQAAGASLALGTNWAAMLLVGAGYPPVAEAAGAWGFVPFIVVLALFLAFFQRALPETLGKSSREIQRAFLA
ncbi:hypothetical protein ATCC90586_004628 [Pythium insidiosum]|nr:hypothetical protein ATCC90586_004628 [Pythium insidiosum]